jgi:hypothetical protein
MQSDLFHFKVTLHVSRVTAPIIRSAKNCNRSLRYRHQRLRLQFLVLLMMGAVTPETCRVTLQGNKSDCVLLRLVGLLFNINYDAWNHDLKKNVEIFGRSWTQILIHNLLP